MRSVRLQLLDELREVLGELGKGGGKISPSVYDTAQGLRFFPPVEGVEPALDWLLAQQESDGGWCDPAVPAARDASTLAAVLAIRQYRGDGESLAAIEAGLAFLRRQAVQWRDIPLDGLPIAVEVILPRLIGEAHAAGLEIDPTPYARLYALGQKKLDILERMEIGAGSAPTYSWEAFGTEPSAKLLDRMGSVGHSPAATARWLQLAADKPELADAAAGAVNYLARAHAATDVNVPGVLPVVYPIKAFELCYSPYALLLAGLEKTPSLRDKLRGTLQELVFMLESENGVGFGDGFVPDVDDTGVAMAVLVAMGQQVDPRYVMQFYQRDHFFTFAYELNPSVFSNAHAIHALALAGKRVPAVETFLLSRQENDGRWPPDKWHTAWRYTTLEVTAALAQTQHWNGIRQAMAALASGQSHEGYWRNHGCPSRLDTAYSVIGLTMGKRLEILSGAQKSSLAKGNWWLVNSIHMEAAEERRWLSKEVYSPRRVDRIFYLCAGLAALTAQAPLNEAISV